MAKITFDPWKSLEDRIIKKEDKQRTDPLFDNPYIPPKLTRAEKEIRREEKIRAVLAGKMRTKLDEDMIDSLTSPMGGTKIYHDGNGFRASSCCGQYVS